MASVTITIPDALVPRVQVAIKWRFGDDATPKGVILDILRSAVRDYEQMQAETAAGETVRAQVVAELEDVK